MYPRERGVWVQRGVAHYLIVDLPQAYYPPCLLVLTVYEPEGRERNFHASFAVGGGSVLVVVKTRPLAEAKARIARAARDWLTNAAAAVPLEVPCV